eukprot:TRINITY_DN44298_c0_g1_i2.p1 TRINITY_DN44298_c0_g1~~TRINITY_DN44298_c0_g1_i2.p1  ORF type:complete len:147 (+),score=2.38 TRINITY_DN44298_c0_g1_i2:157-597(+)
MARRRETGIISRVGDNPTILSDHDGATLRFAYRNVKRAAAEQRHQFVVGDRVEFRRENRPGAIGRDGAHVPVFAAKQVRLVAPALREGPVSTSEEGSSPTSPPTQRLPVALPVAIPVARQVGDRVWRYDPYSVEASQVDCSVPAAS